MYLNVFVYILRTQPLLKKLQLNHFESDDLRATLLFIHIQTFNGKMAVTSANLYDLYEWELLYRLTLCQKRIKN